MKLTKSSNKILLLTICLIFSSVALAQPNPMNLMRSISNRMLSALKVNRPRIRKNPRYVYTLVKQIVIPHADLPGVSRSVLGRNAWNSSSQNTRKQFIAAFTNVMIGTYASALNAYKDESIKFFPIRGGYTGKTRILIQSQVIRSDGPPISVNYKLALMNNKWKIYDLNVEGVSLLQSFYSQFQAQLSQGKSVAQITRELKQRNK